MPAKSPLSRYVLFCVICALILSAHFSYAESDDNEAPPSYAENQKRVLDENIRYIKPPSGAEYGLLRERRVHLKVGASEIYDDNIFLTKDDTKFDYITDIAPGMYAYSGNEQNIFLAFYDADILIYSRHSSQTRINQTIGGRADMFRNGQVKVTIKDTLRPTTDAATSEVTDVVKRMYNVFEGAVRYDMSPRTSMAFSYNQEIQYYISEPYEDYTYMRQTCSPVIYWHLSPKTSLTGEYNLAITNYDGMNYDSTFHQARAGIEGRLSPKSTIYLRGGYQYRIYDEADRKNVQGFVLEGVYDYTLSPKSTVEIIAASNINESVYSDAGYYKSINLYGSLKHRPFNNLDVDINGLYIRSDYPRDSEAPEEGGLVKRSDDLYGAGAKITYRFRTWISSFINYEFRWRNSNIRVFGYKNNRVSGGVNISF